MPRSGRWGMVFGLVAVSVWAAAGCDDRPPANMPGDRWPEAPPEQQPAVQPGQAARPGAPGADRYCELIEVDPERVAEYRGLHEQVPREVKEALRRCGVRNFSVFLCGTRHQIYAIRCYEYTGSAHAVDMAQLDRDPDFKKWRNAYEECQVSLMPAASGDWWAPSKEILHLD